MSNEFRHDQFDGFTNADLIAFLRENREELRKDYEAGKIVTIYALDANDPKKVAQAEIMTKLWPEFVPFEQWLGILHKAALEVFGKEGLL